MQLGQLILKNLRDSKSSVWYPPVFGRPYCISINTVDRKAPSKIYDYLTQTIGSLLSVLRASDTDLITLFVHDAAHKGGSNPVLDTVEAVIPISTREVLSEDEKFLESQPFSFQERAHAVEGGLLSKETIDYVADYAHSLQTCHDAK